MHFDIPSVMTHIYIVLEQGGELVGDFDLVDRVDLTADVRALKERIKASRSRLRNVDLGDMTVFGVWAAKPLRAVWTAALKEGDAALDPAATLGALIGDKECAYFIVRITAPPLAAAAGASGIAIIGSGGMAGRTWCA